MASRFHLQIHRIIFLSDTIIFRSYPGYGRGEDSRLRRQVFGNALHEPSCVHIDDHVCYGSGVLFGYLPFVYYWNTVFSIGRSFVLGLSIWMPWKEIYTLLPKRIYAKILTTSDMEVK